MRSTLPTDANQDTLELGLLIDRAFKQTVERGGTYAVVPVPWLNAWVNNGYVNGHEWAFGEHCWMDRVVEGEDGGDVIPVSEIPIDGEGNYLICLLPAGHEGACATDWLVG